MTPATLWPRRWAVLLGTVIVVGLTACGPSDPTVMLPTDPPSPPTDVAGPTGDVRSPGIASPSSRGGLQVDAGLLEQLPGRVDGVDRQADPDTAAEIARNAELATSAEAIAVALYIGGPAASEEVGDYAVVTVTRLRDGVLGPDFHRDWRDSFDAGVCEQAGGLDGRAEAQIGEHEAFIGTCVGGVRTYHVVLADGRTLVSMQALGERRLGERIIEGLAQ